MGHVRAAVDACKRTTRSTASVLSRRPIRVGNNGWSPRPPRSASQTRSTAWVVVVSGTARCFRPLPKHRTLAPSPKMTSPQSSPVSSDTRSPVCAANSSRARSLRPSHATGVGCADQGLDLGRGEERDDLLLEPFGRDRQDPLDHLGVLGVTQCGEGEQGADGGQPQVAGARAVVSVVFEVLEERGDQFGVEVGPIQAGGGSCRCESGRTPAAA